ncbi:MAG: hypothetical protein CMP71_04460 [Flavobacteriales bacterium]|nr:hypothetical protein [Flavobacteriales bacterium]|tara:strand:+ start:43615 stop:44478 length:864 start_codon:yes stop_codon:yes gene_type:complete
MKTKIIVNPISGTQNHRNIHKIFEKYLKDYEIVYTEYQNHAFEISKNLNKKFDRVIVAGGDGTVNECIRGLIDKDIILATLPCGSGNGFSLHNNIDTNLDNAIKNLSSYKEIKSDVWTINGNPFINVSGLGFDALIANSFSKLKNRGFSSYIKLVLKNIIAYKPQEYNIEIDNEEINTDAFFIAFANASEYGNGAIISPKSKINDGLLDIVIVNKFNKLLIPKLIFFIFKKRIHKFKKVIIKQGKMIRITPKSKESFLVHLDGEPKKISGSLDIRISKRKMKVLINE